MVVHPGSHAGRRDHDWLTSPGGVRTASAHSGVAEHWLPPLAVFGLLDLAIGRIAGSTGLHTRLLDNRMTWQ